MHTFRRLTWPARISVIVIVFALLVTVVDALGLSGDDARESPSVTSSLPPRGSATETTPTVPPTTPSTSTAPAGSTTTVPSVPPSASGGSTDPLSGLIVADERRAGYDRELFVHWIDADGDGCDTRREVLISESLSQVTIGDGCRLSGGSWVSPFDGVATREPSDLDIDHLVPLAEAWDSGAHAWTPRQRRDFANDLTEGAALVAVTDNLNQQKSDQDPAEWLPPLAAYRCTYVRDWVTVKKKWNLSVDRDEATALRRVLASC